MFSGCECLLSHCVKSREVVAKKEVATNSKNKLCLSVRNIDHVDLWASAVSEAFWDATGGFNSTHMDLNYTRLAVSLRFSIEALFPVDVRGLKKKVAGNWC